MNSAQFIVIARLFSVLLFAVSIGSFPWSLVSGYSGMPVRAVGTLIGFFLGAKLLPSIVLWCIAPWLAKQASGKSLSESPVSISAYDLANIGLFLFGLYWIVAELQTLPSDIWWLMIQSTNGFPAEEIWRTSSRARIMITAHVLQLIVGLVCLFGSKRIARQLVK